MLLKAETGEIMLFNYLVHILSSAFKVLFFHAKSQNTGVYILH